MSLTSKWFKVFVCVLSLFAFVDICHACYIVDPCANREGQEKGKMIHSVKGYLDSFRVDDKKIVETIGTIERKFFVPEHLQNQAHLDVALPIEKGQTISQPSTVARMLQLLQLKKRDNVLEVGTGSGWSAALLAYIVDPGQVVTLELHKELIDRAKKRFKKLNLTNITVKDVDFKVVEDKFDKIIFTAGIGLSQEKLIDYVANKNLKDGGLLVCPFRSGPLIIIEKKKSGLFKEFSSEQYRFVPLQ
ncbi:methyltransferase domain-containing protein [bacterium]|mgnify:CR=1 FL=1|jgi:protein-L-isoaspartate(D-aspartate) O-methyltransferase|nr:methyltransferase domain-containing protein [bacterium]